MIRKLLKGKGGDQTKELKELNKQKKPRGRPPKPPITTAMMQARLLDMVKQYNIDHGIETKVNDLDIDKLFEPFCVS